MKPDKQIKFLDSPETQKKFRIFFYISLCILLIVDLIPYYFLEHVKFFDRPAHFSWEEIPIFNAVYGFTACVGLIFIAKILRWIVKRKEDYYD